MRPRARCFLGPGERRGFPLPLLRQSASCCHSAPAVGAQSVDRRLCHPALRRGVSASAGLLACQPGSQHSPLPSFIHSFLHSSLPIPPANPSCPSAPFSATVPARACQWSASFPRSQNRSQPVTGASWSTSQLSTSSPSRPLPSVDACKGVTELGHRVGGVVSVPSHLDTSLLACR